MRVLVVEDEADLARQLAEDIRSGGYSVDLASNGEEALELACMQTHDAIVLDLGLPGIDGLQVLEKLRAEGVATPVLVLTVRGRWYERVAGIDAGADDYLPKPFRMEELLARLRALLRRSAGRASPVLRHGAVTLDTRSLEVRLEGERVHLTAYELKVLRYLLHNQGRVVSVSELVEHVYAQDWERDSNTIEVFIARLRRKLGRDLIRTLSGLGYQVPEQTGSDHPGAGLARGRTV